MTKKTIDDFLRYTAESIVDIEKIIGKIVEGISYDSMETQIKADGQMKIDFSHKVSLKFHVPKPTEPVPITVVNGSAMPLIDKTETNGK